MGGDAALVVTELAEWELALRIVVGSVLATVAVTGLLVAIVYYRYIRTRLVHRRECRVYLTFSCSRQYVYVCVARTDCGVSLWLSLAVASQYDGLVLQNTIILKCCRRHTSSSPAARFDTTCGAPTRRPISTSRYSSTILSW